jgi:hypothetical protein
MAIFIGAFKPTLLTERSELDTGGESHDGLVAKLAHEGE